MVKYINHRFIWNWPFKTGKLSNWKIMGGQMGKDMFIWNCPFKKKKSYQTGDKWVSLYEPAFFVENVPLRRRKVIRLEKKISWFVGLDRFIWNCPFKKEKLSDWRIMGGKMGKDMFFLLSSVACLNLFDEKQHQEIYSNIIKYSYTWPGLD